MTPKAIEQASPDVREVIDRKLRAALDAAVEQHMPVMVVQTAYLSDVADHMLRLQAELAEAREVPGRIVAWLQDEAVKDAGVLRRLHAEKKLTQLMTEAWDTLIQTKTGIATAIGARDWSKP